MHLFRTLGCFGILLVAALPAKGAGQRSFPQHTLYRPGTLKPAPSANETLESEVIAFYRLWRTRFLKQIEAADLPANSPAPQAFVNVNHGLSGPGYTTFRSVSEGHGYGLLISALMADAAPEIDSKADFDALLRYFNAHPSRPDSDPDKPERHPNLMAFEQTGNDLPTLAADSLPNQTDSASDGDMDIGYALLLADRQWGGTSPNYRARAQAVIDDVMQYDVQHDPSGTAITIKFGDAIVEGSSLLNATRSSDFMVQHWRTFANASPGSARPQWEALRESTYRIEANVFANFAPLTGLMPDFMKKAGGKFYTRPATGEPRSQAEVALYKPPTGKLLENRIGDGNWSYNACRTPWRLATDYLLNFDDSDEAGVATRAHAQLEVLNAWVQRTTTRRLEMAAGSSRVATAFVSPAATPDPGRINAGYYLNGKPIRPEIADHGSCFNGPLAVSAMTGPENQAWLNALWQNLLQADANDPSGEEEYYRATVKMLCMIVLSGNWWDPIPAAEP